jgi:hypothetical protein
MKVFGYSTREFFRIGLAAVVFILVLKWVAPKVNQPALTSTVEKI